MATPWSVPRLFEGRTVAILATGPSMSQAVADTVRGRCGVIAVQDAFKLAPWADLLYGCDPEWWSHHQAHTFAGLKVTCVDRVPHPEVMCLRNTGTRGFDPDPGCIRTGSNSGYQALHVAAHTGARRILLCGYDMHGSHFFGPHPKPLRNTTESLFAVFIRNFDAIAAALKARGIEVFNCTPGSRLRRFPFADLGSML